MMKFLRVTFVLCAMLLLLGTNIYADELSNSYIEDFRGILPEESGDFADSDALVGTVSIESLLSEIITAASGESGRVTIFLLSLIGMGIMITLSGECGARMSSVCERAVGAVTSLVVFSYVGALFSSAREGIEKIASFLSAAVPIYTAISVSSGATSTAASQAAGMNFTASLLGGAGIKVMTSVVGLGLAMALISFFSDARSDALSKSASGLFKWVCGLATAIIMATLSLQSIVCTAQDSAVLRAAKYAASGMIPIVGGTVSGALSTLAAGLAYAKGIVGAGSVALIITMTLAPLTVLLLYRAALAIAISVLGFIGSNLAVRIYTAYKNTLDAICATYALCACLTVFEIILFMKSGVVS